MPLSPNCGRLLVCVFVLLLGYAGYSFSKSNAAIKEVAAEISAEGGIKVTRAPFPIALPGAMTQASSLAPQAPGHAAGESWPHNCPTGAILAAYPNSSAARTFHMSGIMDRIGACGKVVSAVMRDKVTTASENGFVTAVYEGEVIMRNKGKKLPTGNAPNAATHMRMIKEGANADGLEAHDWMLYFEDDAQLHANVREAFATPGEVQKLLKWSFMVRCCCCCPRCWWWWYCNCCSCLSRRRSFSFFPLPPPPLPSFKFPFFFSSLSHFLLLLL